jgi:hypothetical protein
VTASAGRYLFGNLPAAAYLVWVTDPLHILSGYSSTVIGPQPDLDDHNRGQPYAVSLSAGQSLLTVDFGYRGLETAAQGVGSSGMIGSQVWLDVDGDGLYTPGAADIPIGGVTVDLLVGGAVISAAATDAQGRYLFADLEFGDYQVLVSDRHGVLATLVPTALGPRPGQDNNNQAQPYAVTLGALMNDLTADFGYTAPVGLGGRTWVDLNGNGLVDEASPTGIDGVQITILGADGQQTAQIGSVNGYYAVSGLRPQTFTVTVTGPPLGYQPSSAQTITVALTSGEFRNNLNFGYVYPTAVLVQEWVAFWAGDRVALTWRVLPGEGAPGFSVWRADADAATWAQVSQELVFAADITADVYHFADAAVKRGQVYWYRLQTEPAGQIVGPLRVRVPAPVQIYLP